MSKVRAMLAGMKQAVLGTPFEPAARFVANRIAPLAQTARHPEFACLYHEAALIEQVLDDLVKPGMNCVDVGAHIGSVVCKFRRRSPEGKHVAVEPTPWKAKRLREKFPDVTVHECALGARSGKASFIESLAQPALNRLAVGDGGAPIDDRLGLRLRGYEVDVRTLDGILDRARPIGVLKIDAEGAEPAVLAGAVETLRRDRPAIMFEWGAGDQASAGVAGDPFEILTSAHGYKVFSTRSYVYSRTPLSRELFDHCRAFPAIAFNFIALPS